MESGRGRCLFASGGQVAKMLVDLYQYPSEIRVYSNIRGGGGELVIVEVCPFP